MIYKCWLLIKIQLLGFFRVNAVLHSNDKKEKRRLAMMGAVYSLLGLLIVFYSVGMSVVLALLGQAESLPSLMLTVSALLTLVLTFLKCNGTLFGMEDYDLIMSMPVSSQTVILSRLFSMYLFNFLINLVILAPASVIFALNFGAGVSVILMLVLGMFLAPLVPMVAATAVGAIIMAIAARFRRKNLFVLLLSLGATIAVLVLSFSFQNTDIDRLVDIGLALDNAVARIYPLSAWFSQGVTGGDWRSFGLFALSSVTAAVLLVLLLSRFYRQINTWITTHASGKRYQMGALNTGTPFYALYKRELKLLASCSVYALNSCIGAVLVIVAGIAMLFVDVEGMLHGLGMEQGLPEALTLCVPFLICVVIGLNSTTSSALSLEGASRWIMCSIPVESEKIFGAKIAVNLTVMAPAALVSGVLFSVALGMSLFSSGVTVFILLVYTLFISVMGMYYNIRFPRYDWTTEQQAVKQGTVLICTMLTGFLTAGCLLAIALVFAEYILLVHLLAVCLLLVVTWRVYRRMKQIRLYV